MSKRQANLIVTLLSVVIALQVLGMAVLFRGQERTRKEAEAAQVSSMDVLEMQKRAERSQAPSR